MCQYARLKNFTIIKCCKIFSPKVQRIQLIHIFEDIEIGTFKRGLVPGRIERLFVQFQFSSHFSPENKYLFGWQKHTLHFTAVETNSQKLSVRFNRS
jgi:hypothetical protein